MLETLVRQLGRELKMEELIENPDTGHFILPFEDNVRVDLTESAHSYLLKGLIAPCPVKNKQFFINQAMGSNLFGRGTRGAALGLSPDGKTLTLSLEIDSSANYKEFTEKLEDFVSILDFWRKEAAKQV